MLPGQNSLAIRADHPDWKCSKLLLAEKTGVSEPRINAIMNPELLSELFCRLRLAFRDVAAGQAPRALATEWHCQEFP